MRGGMEIRVPVNYTALTGDLEIHVQNLSPEEGPYYLQLLEYYYPTDNSFTIIGSTPLRLDNTTTIVYKAKFPCGLIAQGGRYGVRIQSKDDADINEILVTISDDADMIDVSNHSKVKVLLKVMFSTLSHQKNYNNYFYILFLYFILFFSNY